MSISDLFGSGKHVRNYAHFTSLVNLASVHGEITEDSEAVLKQLARKLGINKEAYKKALVNPSEFPVDAPNSYKRRLERLYDVLSVIFANNVMEPEEEQLLKKYAVALGFSAEDSQKIINRSIPILSGQLSFEDYLYLLEK